MLRVGLNGFGRIGRAIYRINEERKQFQIVAINDIDPNVENHAYLLKYDSTYGRFNGSVDGHNGDMYLFVNGQRVQFYASDDVAKVPWHSHDIDVVIDASGVYRNVRAARQLVDEGLVKKVVITHSPKDGVDKTIVFGVNEDEYDHADDKVVSTSICDVNGVAPVLYQLDQAFGIEFGYITTLHPWLSYQNLVDGSVRSISSPGHFWKDFSLGRASNLSLIPKNTTVVNAISKVLPDLASRLDAVSFRIPTGIVSASDVSLVLKQDATANDINALFQNKALRNSRIIGYEDDYLVSIDFLKISESVFVDGRWTRVNNGKHVKMVLWYDNEWGYSQRVVDMLGLMERKFEYVKSEQEVWTIAE
ncbi:aldehyde dehydrogenase [candidate division KSB1 bacterium]|nr:aldehyde dehydrogenase [candidate division KSB1 bacterium]